MFTALNRGLLMGADSVLPAPTALRPSQVIRLAQEVSALQRQLAEVVGLRREQLDAELMRVAAQVR